ncbi:MAG TPA: hypothetical protein VKA60_13150 [Blastocatellia bacterium]|nr:hypothetical protein [Blastocatellia bacterium]
MSKPPEEGQIWEWRGFGAISPEIAAQVESRPIRNGIRDLPGTDVYLIPPISEQNVKLRLTDRGWVLKFKRLLEKHAGGIELYHETERWTFAFPISLTTMQQAARLLEVTLPAVALYRDSFDREETLAFLRQATPAIEQVETKKVRSQYQFAGGWLEIADVMFGDRRIQSLSLHSQKVESVERMLAQLHPDDCLPAMNYVEACRRLG